VREVFVRLYEKGLIYRGNYIINWCPRCLTALSDEEAEPEETQGRLYHLRYPVAGDAAPDRRCRACRTARAYVVVATTRPETMLGDTAVAVHPDDERYAGLVGAGAAAAHRPELPGRRRRLRRPGVRQRRGQDHARARPERLRAGAAPRHAAALNVMTPTRAMNDEVPEAFRGLDRFEARRAWSRRSRSWGSSRRSRTHRTRCRTATAATRWWSRALRAVVRADEAARGAGARRVARRPVRFTPDRWTKVYEHWLENIRDWCISGSSGGVTASPSGTAARRLRRDRHRRARGPDACPKCGSAELEQDPDVLDTWFSSWLWPFSTLGWPDETDDLRAFYPTHTLVTAPEILFFWVARMIMAGYEFMGDAPFRDVYLTGTVRDMQGRKMSKSLGNGIDPLEVVELYGADALRYTVISGVGFGTDVHMDPRTWTRRSASAATSRTRSGTPAASR
jgi:valyl-tRNA synthetase